MRQCEKCGAERDAEEAISPRCGHDTDETPAPARVVGGAKVPGGVSGPAPYSAGTGGRKAPSAQPRLTLLVVGGVILGGVAGFGTGYVVDTPGTRGLVTGAWGKGVAGATLGFIVGLGVI